MYAGSDEHTVRHKWVINKDRNRPERGVKLFTDRKDDKQPGGWSKQIVGHCPAFERDLSKVAKEKANEVMHAKRETAKRKKIPQRGVRSGGDQSMSCPVIAAIGTKTRGSGGSSGPSADPPELPSDWRDTAAPFLEAMKSMTSEALLACLSQEGIPAAQELQELQLQLEDARQFQAASRAALKDAAVFGRTNQGRQTYQTILTACAYDGDEGTQALPGYRKAEILGVDPAEFSRARQRVKSLQPHLPPAAALEAGAYWYRSRRKRSDATPPELVELMKDFWHNNAVSRLTGNSAHIFRESKSPTARTHPRRQLMVEGGGETVFKKFLESPEFNNFKRIWRSEKGEDIKDPGRTRFLSTRCKCLTAPKTDQCACKIHTQQTFYLEALENMTLVDRPVCDCRWCSAEDGDAIWKGHWRHLGTFSDALACPKVDLRAGDPEEDSEVMGRKPECASSDCNVCGFGKEGGIPFCKVLETSKQLVKWKHYGDLERPGKTTLRDQVLEKEGELCDLWADFKKHSKVYMAHHSKAKWQRNCHNTCLRTFQDGDIVIETDFIEKYTHEPQKVLTCARHDTTTLMVAIVHFCPQEWEGGGRVHLSETWVFASADPAHDFDFHLHALKQIADYYLDGEGSAATACAREDNRVPRMLMFTDGCAKQYKGRRNFRFLSNSVRELGFVVEHHFAATSHFKGCHDGIGGVVKNAMKKSEQLGKPITGAKGVVEFVENYFADISKKSLSEYFARWSAYRIRRVHTKLIGPTAIYRPKRDLVGITGTRDNYVFIGANTPTLDASTATRLGRKADVPDVVKRDLSLATGVDEGVVNGTGLTVVAIKEYVPWSAAWEEKHGGGVGSDGGGEEASEDEGEDGDGRRRTSRKRTRSQMLVRSGEAKEEEEEEEEQEEQDAGAGAGAGGCRRSGRRRAKNVTLRDQGWDESSSSEEDTSGLTGGLVGVCRRSGRRRMKNVTLKDQGWDQSSSSQSSSGAEDEESEPEAEAAVDGADGEYKEREGGAESSEEEEEEEEMGGEVVSGVETVSVEKRTVDHETNEF
eukprot:g7897.t1